MFSIAIRTLLFPIKVCDYVTFPSYFYDYVDDDDYRVYRMLHMTSNFVELGRKMLVMTVHHLGNNMSCCCVDFFKIIIIYYSPLEVLTSSSNRPQFNLFSTEKFHHIITCSTLNCDKAFN